MAFVLEIYHFLKNQGLVWSPVADDAIHLSLIARQIDKTIFRNILLMNYGKNLYYVGYFVKMAPL